MKELYDLDVSLCSNKMVFKLKQFAYEAISCLTESHEGLFRFGNIVV